MVTQENKFHKDSDLLVKSKLKQISKLTSNPKRVCESLTSYMGTQNYHQTEIGRMWFMRSLLRKNIFPHEVQVTAKKTIYGFNWREMKNNYDSRVVRQCRNIVETRLNITNENLRKWWKVLQRRMRVINKMLSHLKIRIPRK